MKPEDYATFRKVKADIQRQWKNICNAIRWRGNANAWTLAYSAAIEASQIKHPIFGHWS